MHALSLQFAVPQIFSFNNAPGSRNHSAITEQLPATATRTASANRSTLPSIFSPIRTITVGSGLSPDLLTSKSDFWSARGLPEDEISGYRRWGISPRPENKYDLATYTCLKGLSNDFVPKRNQQSNLGYITTNQIRLSDSLTRETRNPSSFHQVLVFVSKNQDVRY